ncbi:MAG: hypothetical protein JW997_07520 [Actinobacteria bacterium]|nr:hypothetical protein [Actinomycetota bacterium]
MKIKFKITGMHCQGCANLIKLNMEEYGFTDINTDIASGNTTAVTERKNIGDAKSDLESAFAEMPDYTFSDIDKAD